jgi:dihydrofolate reductase
LLSIYEPNQKNMLISAIVAMANQNVIGHDNEIPWYLPEDFKWFKKQTLGHAIIMGRKCFESIGRPLPKRTNIIITRDMFYLVNGCTVVHSLAEALQVAENEGETEVFIIGGGEIYAQSMHLYDKIYLTNVHADIKGSIVFPVIEEEDWDVTFEEYHVKDEKNEYDFTFRILERK